MKKIFLLILACLVSITAHAIEYEDAVEYEDSVVKKTETSNANQAISYVCGTDGNPVKIAGFMNFPPISWKEGKGKNAKYYGVGVDIFEVFARNYNLKYEYVDFLNHDEARKALKNKQIDLLVSDVENIEEESPIEYLQPSYLTNQIVIVYLTPKIGEKAPQTLADLKGKKGYVREEEFIYPLLRSYLPDGVQLEEMTGAKNAFTALLNKDVDFLLMSQVAVEAEMRRFKLFDRVSYSSSIVFTMPVFMTYLPDNDCALFMKNMLSDLIQDYKKLPANEKEEISKFLNLWEERFIQVPPLK